MKYKTLNNTNIHREQNKQKNNWNNSSVIINRKVIQGGGSETSAYLQLQSGLPSFRVL